MIESDPSFDFDRDLESSVLLERFDGLQRRLVAHVNLRVEPSDAEVRLDGEIVDWTEPLPLLTGAYSVTVERPGFVSQSGQIDVEAGDSDFYEITLERVSAVLYIQTQPPATGVVKKGSY